jgi:hypothetical protein
MSITHETRRESYSAVKLTLTERQRTVLRILREGGDLTAREVAAVLHLEGITPTDERNFAAPRLTELAGKELVTAVGKKICAKTGRKVSVWSVVKTDAEMRIWLDSLERGGKGGGQNE